MGQDWTGLHYLAFVMLMLKNVAEVLAQS